jgi:hypothetical protein
VTAVILHRLVLAGTTIIAMSLTAPALGQDRMVLGPRQFEQDKSGAGAVLCSWALYLSIQAQTAACALPRQPTDDAIDQAITAIDDFILANSSLHPTRAALEAFKREATARDRDQVSRQPQFCTRPDLERFRSMKPERVKASVRALLAVPREPVMNPCL